MSTSAVPQWHWPWLHQHVRDNWRTSARDIGRWIIRLCCGIRGHDRLLHLEGNRLCLECSRCGQQTPGWRLGSSEPRVAFTRVRVAGAAEAPSSAGERL